MKRTLLLFLSIWVGTMLQAFSQNNALHFDGTNDFVAIPSVGTNLSSFTIETWINPETTAPDMGIVNTDVWAAGSVHFQFMGGKVVLSVNGINTAETGNAWPVMTAIPSINVWQHIAVTYDGAAKKIIFYLNGVASGSYTFSSLPVANFTVAAIGNWTQTRPYLGKMDEVRIWNKSLTAADINAKMKSELAGTESGLIAYYNYNQGTASGVNSTITTLIDKTLNHFVGTLTNFSLLSGNISNWVPGFVVPSAPGTPNAVTAVAGNLKAKVSFTPPASDGGSPITSYTVTSNPDGKTGVEAASPITVTGLTAGQAYTFTVVAANAFGNSVASAASTAVTPFSAPTPVVTSVAVPANGYYKAGDALTFTVNFDIPENVTGSPSLTIGLNTGGNVAAAYVSGSGSNSLVFKYTVAAGNIDDDGITIGAIALNGGTIQSAIGADANLTLPTVPVTAGVKVDAVAPAQTSVDCPYNKTYIMGQDMDLSANFDENVIVETSLGIPYMHFQIGTTTVRANYVSGSGSKKIVFRYTVANNDYDADGIGANLNIQLNGATFKDIAGNNAGFQPWPNMFFPLSTAKVDGVVPIISSVSLPANATYVEGQSFSFTMNFSEPVAVVTTGGNPYIALTIGSSTLNAAYISGSGTTALVFKYTVANGDLDSDGISMATSITANGATLKDVNGNSASLTFTAPNTSDIKVDAVSPAVSGNPTATDNNYTTGQSIDVSLSFSEDVVVTGSPYITLTVGSTLVQAAYLSGTTTNTLVFRYTVIGGDFDADGVAVSANITGNGGTIKDNAGNSAALTFTASTLTGVYVNVTPPTVTTQAVSAIATTTATGNGDITSLGNVNPTQYGVVWSTTGNPTVALPTKTAQGAASTTGVFTSSITSLWPNTQYFVKAYATNNAGTSYGSEVSFTTLDIVPNAPTDVVATAGIAQATISFTAPVSNGGSAIIRYTVTSSPGGKAVTETASPLTITGLTNGTPYTFSVVATNSLGNSNPSAASTPVTPFSDTEKPVITGTPSNISVSTDAGKPYSTVSWTEPNASDNVGVTSFTSTIASGSQFPIGSTIVSYTATDAAGNIATAGFTVTVSDIEKPEISALPDNISESNEPGSSFATVSWTAPTASDNVGVTGFTPDHAIGSQFPVGITTVTYTATDAAGNIKTASFTVTVSDNEKPVIGDMPANIPASTDAGKDYATVTWTAPSATDNVGITSFTPDHAMGSQFPVGTTTVTYTASDAAGNTGTASFMVTVTTTTGISPVNGAEIKVYPNPVTDFLNIITGNTGDNGTYAVRSVAGTLAAHGAITKGQAIVNMEKASSGIYIVQIQIGNLHTSCRFVKN